MTIQRPTSPIRLTVAGSAVLLAGIIGCSRSPAERSEPEVDAITPATFLVKDTMLNATFDAAGVAEPVQRATLSTRLMGNVVAVLVHEGERVAAGQTLLRLDAREVDSRRAQVEAGLGAAEAVYRDAVTQAERFRGLYKDSAATRFQLDQAETGLVRAEAGLKTAEAGLRELNAVGSYTVIQAPFAGVITRRLTDPGAFAAPGTPLMEIQDPSRLRVSVSAPPAVAAALNHGAVIDVAIENRLARGVVEGIVPSDAGTVYRVNVVVDNRRGDLLVGGAAVVSIPSGTRRTLLVPASAVVHQGDLTGVRVFVDGKSELRWVRLGGTVTGSPKMPMVEVLSGLAVGDAVVGGEI